MAKPSNHEDLPVTYPTAYPFEAPRRGAEAFDRPAPGSDVARLDAKIAKRRKNALIGVVAGPVLAIGYEIVRGRDRSKAKRAARKALATTIASQAIYELGSQLYRRTLSDEVSPEATRTEPGPFDAIEIHDLANFAMANSIVGVGRKYFETRSVAAAARRAAVFGVLWGAVLGLGLAGRSYLERSERSGVGGLDPADVASLSDSWALGRPGPGSDADEDREWGTLFDRAMRSDSRAAQGRDFGGPDGDASDA